MVQIMNVSVVDIGSNSVRFSIYSVDKQNCTFSYLVNERYMIGLIGYVNEKKLSQDGVSVLCSTIQTINSIIKKYELSLQDIYFFATASLRNLDNIEYVLDTIKSITNVSIDIISGDEEALYSFLGATMENCNIINNHDKIGTVVDIGGGSTEVIYYDRLQKNIISNYSEPLGSLALKRKFCKDTIPTYDEYIKIANYTNGILNLHNKYTLSIIIGVGGTCRNLFNIARLHYTTYLNDTVLDTCVIDMILNMLKEKDSTLCQEFLQKTVPERVETMFTGLMILSQIISITNAKYITMTDFGVKEGYLISTYFTKV